MIINGEKWACEACVRGHRVSNCQHSDRRLQHINRKGRPVSQCQHCRAMRKSRSAHVKCDCGSKNKCTHLQPTMEGHKETCCCNHGAKCTCAPKETLSLETVPEAEKEPTSASLPRASSIRRRRANTTSSEGVSATQASRHKTAVQKKRLSQKAGVSSLSRTNSATECTSSAAQRDVISRPRSSNSHHFESEVGSPDVAGSPTFPHHLTPLDMSRITYPSYVSSGGFDLFNGTGFSDHDAPLSSAGLAPPSDSWSTSDFSASSYRMAHSYGSALDYDRLPNLASTGTTSGDVSEVDDNFMAGDEDFFGGGGGSGSGSSGYIPQNHMYGHGHNTSHNTSHNMGKYLSNVGSFDDELFALRYNDGVATMPESPDEYNGVDYTYYGAA